MIERDLKKYAANFHGYTELRLHENRNLDITLLNGSLYSNMNSVSGGVSARVYLNGSWGFSSAPGMDTGAIEYCLKKASDNAKFLDSRKKLGKDRFVPLALKSVNDLSTGKPRKSRQEVVDFLKEVDRHLVAASKNIKSRRIWFGGLDSEKSLLTSDEAEVYSMIPRTRMVIYLSGEKNGEKADLYKIMGEGRQFEDAFCDRDLLWSQISELGEHLDRKLEGIYPESGTWDCILSPEMSGMLAHEAIGHTVEADNVLAGAATKNLLGQTVASPLINIVDFAHTAFGIDCPIPIRADDEGVKAEDVRIIEEGVLKAFLHNKESAGILAGKAAGNARAAAFSDEPLIRMRNTAILPGKHRYDELISSVENGYLLLQTGNGQADSTSEFMFGVVAGYELKNGKIGRALKDTTVSGVAYDVLKSVSMISDGFAWLNGGMCSKPQRVTVGMGGPEVKCRMRLGGK